MFKPNKIKVLILLITAILSFAPVSLATEPSLKHYAGTGEAGYSDDKRLAAKFYFPYGLAIDKDGGLLVVDTNNNRVRKVIDNKVVTIAGSSNEKDSYGFYQGGYLDGSVAKAKFNRPRDIAINSKGEIFVTDTLNHVVRKIMNGQVITLAGTGKAGYVDGQGFKAQFNLPTGLTIDKEDNLYVADTLNNIIRKITPEGIVSTFAGTFVDKGGYKDGPVKAALFNEPSDLAINNSGDFYILDSGNQLVRRISDNKVTTIAGSVGRIILGTNYQRGGLSDGFGQNAMFNFPKGIDIADDGTVFIADTWNHRIRAITPFGQVITLAGADEPEAKNGLHTIVTLNGPVDVLYNSGRLYISDMWNNSIKIIPINLADLYPAMSSVKGIQIFIDNKEIEFFDQKPVIVDGKTMVPLRDICENWGAQVVWDGNKIEVAKGPWRKTLAFEHSPSYLQNNTAMVHIRFLAEAMGYSVEWFPQFRAIIIATK